MPKIKGTVAKDLVRVYGSVADMSGRPTEGCIVNLRLSSQCLLNNTMIDSVSSVTTDVNGNFEFYVPKTSDLISIDGKMPMYVLSHKYLSSAITFVIDIDKPEISINEIISRRSGRG